MMDLMGTDNIYLIGSLRNPHIPDIANILREQGYTVFDDWYSPGPEADEKWQDYEKRRGRTYKHAMQGHHVKHVYEFDKYHLDKATLGILVLPAGKSGHLELGYLIGKSIPGFILFDGEPERYDIMYQFATGLAFSLDELLAQLKSCRK